MIESEQYRSGAGEQLALLCGCGKPIEVKRLGCCHSCYERRRHSLRFFGGLRERVLERDRLRCRGCGTEVSLVVHHRTSENRAESLITLCIRCHMRIHHSSGSRYWFPRMLLRLWRELHRREPVQLQLTLEDIGKNKTHVDSVGSQRSAAKVFFKSSNVIPGR